MSVEQSHIGEQLRLWQEDIFVKQLLMVNLSKFKLTSLLPNTGGLHQNYSACPNKRGVHSPRVRSVAIIPSIVNFDSVIREPKLKIIFIRKLCIV